MIAKEQCMAFKALKQGDYVKARMLLQRLLELGYQELKPQYIEAKEHLLRRYWKQEKVEALIKESEGSHRLSLAIARLQGSEAVRAFSKENHPDAWLAQLSLEPSLQAAFLLMRQKEGYKDLAEGWIALLKKDLIKAEKLFLQALPQHPLRAKVALALIDALRGFMKPITELNITPHRFPTYAKLLGVEKQPSGLALSKEQLGRLFYQADFSSLEQVLSRLSPQQTEEKGWVYLRLGDLAYLEKHNLDKAKVYWKKAVSFHPALQLDFLKRTFVILYQQGKNEASQDMFLEYAHVVYQKRKDLWRSFLLGVLSVCSPYFYSQLPLPFYERKQQVWTVDPDLALVLLALAQTREQHRLLFHLDILSSLLPHLVISKAFLDKLPALDDAFSEWEWYVRLRMDLLIFMGQLSDSRKFLIKLLKLNPSLAQELLPQYMKWKQVTLLEDPMLLREEAFLLFDLFPSNFDVACLQLCHGTTPKAHYEAIFSAPLFCVLQLQVSLDLDAKKRAKEFLEQYIPLYGRDSEADSRFWQAITFSKPSFLPFSPIARLFQQSMQDEQRREGTFSRIALYGEVFWLPKLLSLWEKNFPGDWRPYFHRGLALAFKKKDLFKAIKLIDKAFYLQPANHSQAGHLAALLSALEAYGKYC